MDTLVLLIIAGAVLILVLPCLALYKATVARELVEELRSQLADLKSEVARLRHSATPASYAPQEVEKQAPPVQSAVSVGSVAPRQATPPPLHKIPEFKTTSAPLPASPSAERIAAARMAAPVERVDRESPPEVPSPLDWEQFMGAKLFAWIGGLALFLGIVFFVKYSFEHNLVPPEARVAIGFVAGLGLLAGGILMKRKENAVTAQTLCATGILVLYAVTFACRSYYHFPFFGLGRTFVIMSLVTSLAFLLAVRMDAMVVAILGVAGGFLTPVLLSNAEDHPLALFGYIALLDIGLLAIAQRRQWKALPALGAVGTVLTQGAWIATFFVAGHYFTGGKVLIPMAVMAGFHGLFLAAAWWAKHTNKTDHSPANAAVVVGGAAFLTAFLFLGFASLGHRPILLCGYLFLADLGLIALSLVANRLAAIRMPTGIAAFIFLGAWTTTYLTNATLTTALGCYFVFALFHSALPLILQRFEKTPPSLWSHIFPVFSLALVMMPIFEFHDLSILIWPFVLLIDAMAFFVALATLTLAPVLIILLLTLAALGGTLLQVPSELTGLPTDLFFLAGFSIFFLLAGSWAARRLTPKSAAPPQLLGSIGDPANLAVQLPALSAILPFLLLIMVTQRLPLHDPSAVFGLGLLLIVLLLGLAKVLSLDALPLVGLISILALEHSWFASPFHSERILRTLAWYIGFYGTFTLFPFLFRKQFEDRSAPWVAAALSGPFHFHLVYDTLKLAFPTLPHGLPPALFAVPSLLGFALLARKHTVANAARDSQLALFGGAALFFITLIFPLQFERQWITISWALEGAALCWLFRRVPHPGLRLVGFGLLAVAFVRLGLNPLVLGYHARAAHPFFNWYLYAFGVVSLALFAGARLLARPRNLIAGVNAPPLLYTMGTVLAFLLVNIEIADYFNPPGTPVLTFEFSGNFARDMSYSIAWALFALLLLVIGMRNRTAAVRYASLGLLSVTVLKLFFHDLSELDQLYRIGAFIAVAVIAILASFLYQRFLASPPRDTDPRSGVNA
jgi:uncharacterized membrane protein